MANAKSVDLDATFSEFVDEQVSMGRYSSASDVVRAGLKLLRDREATLEAALDEGEESGFSAPFEFDTFLARKRAERAAR